MRRRSRGAAARFPVLVAAVVCLLIACGSAASSAPSSSGAVTTSPAPGSAAKPTVGTGHLPTDAPLSALTLPPHPCTGFIGDQQLALLNGPLPVGGHREIITDTNTQCNWSTVDPANTATSGMDSVRLLFRRHVTDFLFTATSPAYPAPGIGDRAAILLSPGRVDLTVLYRSEVLILEVEHPNADRADGLIQTMMDVMAGIVGGLAP